MRPRRTRKVSRATIIRLAAMVLTSAVAAACKTAILSPCPNGAKLMGAAPPQGQETWCEKLDPSGHAVKDGPFTLYWPNGTKMLEGYYRDGKQDGLWTRFYPGGQRLAVDTYRNGVQEGQHVGWYADGRESDEGRYRDGKREGHWHRWDKSGLQNWDEEYRDDKRVS